MYMNSYTHTKINKQILITKNLHIRTNISKNVHHSIYKYIKYKYNMNINILNNYENNSNKISLKILTSRGRIQRPEFRVLFSIFLAPNGGNSNIWSMCAVKDSWSVSAENVSYKNRPCIAHIPVYLLVQIYYVGQLVLPDVQQVFSAWLNDVLGSPKIA